MKTARTNSASLLLLAASLILAFSSSSLVEATIFASGPASSDHTVLSGVPFGLFTFHTSPQQQVRRRRLSKDDEDDKNDSEKPNDDDEPERTKAPRSPTTKSPTMSPYVLVPTTPYPVAAPPTNAPSSLAPVSQAPVSQAPVSQAPVPIPTAYPIFFSPPISTTQAPTQSNFQFLPNPTSGKTITPTTLSPTFNNKRQTIAVPLKPFQVSIQAVIENDALDERAVKVVYRDDIRKAAQVYLAESLSYPNLLYVQLQSRTRDDQRMLRWEIAETFRYTGEAVFQDTDDDIPDTVLQRQELALDDIEAFQAYILDMPTLQNVQLLESTTTEEELRADTTNDDDSVNTIIVIAVASAVAVTVLLLLTYMVCKLCRKSPPPPPPALEKKASTNASETTDEHDEQPIIEKSKVVETQAKPSKGILRTKKQPPTEHLYQVPMMMMMERKDSTDSMDGYSLGSSDVRKQPPVKPSWIQTPTAAAGDYTSDNESQFSYDNIPVVPPRGGVLATGGRAMSTDSLEDDDDELLLTVDSQQQPTSRETTVVSKKEYYTGGSDTDSFIVPPLESSSSPKKKKTKGFEEEEQPDIEETGSLPFDESIEDSMEQDLDVFTAELEKIKRDIATRRVNETQQQR